MKKTKLALTMAAAAFTIVSLVQCIDTTPSAKTPEKETIITATQVAGSVVTSSQTKTGESSKEDVKYPAITFEYKINEDISKEYGIITATDSQGTCWIYETQQAEIAQCQRIEKLASPSDRTYLNEGGKITAIDNLTGKVLWKNEDYVGGGTCSVVDSDGTLYLSGYDAYGLVVIDNNGKTLFKQDSFEDYMFPVSMDLKGDKLTITYDSEENAKVTVSTSDYTYTIN